jgi:hypothetical protein
MANLGCINKKLGFADITEGIAGTPDSQRRNLVEGSLTVNGSAIDIELKNRTLEKAERGIEAAISTAGEWGGGKFRGPSFWYDLDKSLFALRGTFEIHEGMPDYVATEVKTALEAAGYKITISQPAPAATA